MFPMPLLWQDQKKASASLSRPLDVNGSKFLILKSDAYLVGVTFEKNSKIDVLFIARLFIDANSTFRYYT
jgi:hypothetical protein